VREVLCRTAASGEETATLFVGVYGSGGNSAITSAGMPPSATAPPMEQMIAF
jgi:hypothetical protein